MEKKNNKRKQMGKLVTPSSSLKDGFLEAVKEYERVGENIYMHGSKPDEDFDKLLLKIKERESGENLPKDRVPQTELWFVSGGEFIGWTKIRHMLNEKLLQEGGHIGYSIRPSKRKMGFGNKILNLALQ